jgi:hypothetical protein
MSGFGCRSTDFLNSAAPLQVRHYENQPSRLYLGGSALHGTCPEGDSSQLL